MMSCQANWPSKCSHIFVSSFPHRFLHPIPTSGYTLPAENYRNYTNIAKPLTSPNQPQILKPLPGKTDHIDYHKQRGPAATDIAKKNHQRRFPNASTCALKRELKRKAKPSTRSFTIQLDRFVSTRQSHGMICQVLTSFQFALVSARMDLLGSRDRIL